MGATLHSGPSTCPKEFQIGGESRKKRRRPSPNFPPSAHQNAGTSLLQRATNDDPHAKAELFRTYSRQLYRKAYSVLRNREDAEDALQNSWLNVFANLHSFEGRSSVSTWLTRIVINSALMILRKKRTGGELPLDSLDQNGVEVDFIPQLRSNTPDPEQILLEFERRKVVNEAISSLRPRIRAALELAHRKDLSMKETAQSLGISLPAAKARLFHARTALRNSSRLRAIVQK